MKRILYVVNVDWFFISHRLPIAIEAQRKGYEIHIACALTTYRKTFEKLGFQVHELKITRSGTNFFREINSFLSLVSTIKKVSPNVLHMITIKPVLYGSLISRFTEIEKCVASISGLGYLFISDSLKAKLIRALIKPLYRLGLKKQNNRVIFQNNSDLDLFLHNKIIDDDQAILIKGSGVDLSKFEVQPEPDGAPVIMFLARLLKDKGLIEFCDVARRFKSSKSRSRFVLVGDLDPNNPNSISQRELNSYIEDSSVEFWGYSAEVNKVIPQANIVVLPSYREGLPKSLIEAAACGRAVITTDVPGCRDAITPNKTGLLVAVRDTTSLYDAILNLINNKEFRKLLGSNGRKLAETQFDINDVVKTHLKIYEGKV